MDASSHRSDLTEAKILKSDAIKTLEHADDKLKKYQVKKEDEIITMRKEYETKVGVGPVGWPMDVWTLLCRKTYLLK